MQQAVFRTVYEVSKCEKNYYGIKERVVISDQLFSI